MSREEHFLSSKSAYAPGKLFLFGEYGVVAGGWCVVTALDTHDKLGVRVSQHAGQEHYTIRHGSTITDASDTTELPKRILSRAGSSLNINEIESDLTEAYRGPHKLGIGSSAASCAALTSLALPGSTSEQRFEIAACAHRDFQSGRGSHADVAAATFGGTLAYRLVEPVPPFPALHLASLPVSCDVRRVGFAEIARLQLPDKLGLFAYWLGEPAHTGSKLRRVEEALTSSTHSPRVLSALQTIATCAKRAIDAIAAGEVASIVREAGNGRRAMAALEEASGVAIWTAGASELRSKLSKLPVEIKISGAGGGDFALIFSDRNHIDDRNIIDRLSDIPDNPNQRIILRLN